MARSGGMGSNIKKVHLSLVVNKCHHLVKFLKRVVVILSSLRIDVKELD